MTKLKNVRVVCDDGRVVCDDSGNCALNFSQKQTRKKIEHNFHGRGDFFVIILTFHPFFKDSPFVGFRDIISLILFIPDLI